MGWQPDVERHLNNILGPHGWKRGDPIQDTSGNEIPKGSKLYERYEKNVYRSGMFGRKVLHFVAGTLKLDSRGYAIRTKKMILEVGAGGCVMVTPPAKGSRLDKSLRKDLKMDDAGSVVNIGSGGSGYVPDDRKEYTPKSLYEVHPRDVYVMEPDGRFAVKHTPDGRVEFIVKYRKGEPILDNDGNPVPLDSTAWKRYTEMVFSHDSFGDPVGVLHNIGDIIIGDCGNLIPADFDHRNAMPRVAFRGVYDGQTYRCRATHINEVEHLETEELHVILHRISEELVRRQFQPKDSQDADNIR